MRSLIVRTQPSYTLYFDYGVLTSEIFIATCRQLGDVGVLIVDATVAESHLARLNHYWQQQGLVLHTLIFPGGEENKSRQMKAQLEDELLRLGCGRESYIIALGGGVTLDLAGFVAATYQRGVPYITLPSSLLAMVDVSLGGKTAINHPLGKNLLGTFYQPSAVFIDTQLLSTLATAEFVNGMAEMLKHALLADASFFHELSQYAVTDLTAELPQWADWIYRSCCLKRQFVEPDLQDKGLRQCLNLGHTVGHALEHSSDYQLAHGQAVLLGLLAELYLAMHMGVFNSASWPVAYATCMRYGQFHDWQIDVPRVMQACWRDKKVKQQQIQVVLLQDIGQLFSKPEHSILHPVTSQQIQQALTWLEQVTKIANG